MDLKATCSEFRVLAKRYSEHLHRLRRGLGQVGGDVSIDGHAIDELEIRLHRFRRTDCNPRFRVAIAGAVSVGKSQIINSMMGTEVLPQEFAHCTFIPTVLRKPADNTRRATARYLTAAEIMEAIRYFRQDTSQAWWPATISDASQISEDEVDELLASFDSDDRRLKAGGDLRRLFRALRNPDLFRYVKDSDEQYEREVSWTEMASLVTRLSDNDERFLLSSMVLDLPQFALGDNVEIIDLPGTDADDPWARDITHRCVKDVDAMVVVVDAEKVFSDAAAALLDEMKEWGGHHMERLLFVLNKADRYGDHKSDHIRHAWEQLIGSLGARFPDSPPRIFFVSAKAALGDASAIESLAAIPKTGHARLDELLSEAQNAGGMDYFTGHLDGFLESNAGAVRLASLNNRWSDMLSRVGDTLVPAANKARRELRGGRERKIAQYEEELKGLGSSIAESVVSLRGGASSLRESLVDRGDAFVGQLEAVAASVSSQGERPQDEGRRAAEVAAERWPELNQLFCAKVVGLVQGSLLNGFLRASDEQIGGALKRIEGIEIPPGTNNIPKSPGDPREAMVKSIELRIAELLQDLPSLRPYPQPAPNRLWSAYSKVFSEAIEAFFRMRTREILTELRGFLSFYLTWHLDRFQQSAGAHLEAVGEALLYDHPDCFRSLIGDETERLRGERLQQIVELGNEFDDLAETPLPQGAA